MPRHLHPPPICLNFWYFTFNWTRLNMSENPRRGVYMYMYNKHTINQSPGCTEIHNQVCLKPIKHILQMGNKV